MFIIEKKVATEYICQNKNENENKFLFLGDLFDREQDSADVQFLKCFRLIQPM